MHTIHIQRRVLIVSKERALTTKLCNLFSRDHFVVDTAESEEIGTAKGIHFTYDLIILDAEIPTGEMDMVTILRNKMIKTPILVFHKNLSEEEKAKRLEGGVDIIIEKNTQRKVIVAQIRAFIKRMSPEKEKEINIGKLRLITSRREALYGKKRIALRKRECALLAYLASHPNIVFTRNELYTIVWKRRDMKSNVIDSHITQIRKKLGEKTNGFIRTVHSKGYALIPET